MKNLKKIIVASFLISCSPKIEKPVLTLEQYDRQGAISKGAVAKILNEKDNKKMHEIALAIESSRAINCIPVSEECNALGIVLNRIVKLTQNGILKDADKVELFKLGNQLELEFKKGNKMLTDQWINYLDSVKNNKGETRLK